MSKKEVLRFGVLPTLADPHLPVPQLRNGHADFLASMALAELSQLHWRVSPTPDVFVCTAALTPRPVITIQRKSPLSGNSSVLCTATAGDCVMRPKSCASEQEVDDAVRRCRMPPHPNVARVLALGCTEAGELLELTPYLAGGAIFDKVVAATHMDEGTARRYFVQLVAGLSALHAAGVAHCRLRATKLMLDEGDTLQIVGGGPPPPASLLMRVPGPFHYCAPENSPIVDEAPPDAPTVDVWCAGVVLYAITAGRMPFDDADDRCLLRKIDRVDFPDEPRHSPALRDLIHRMLQRDPDQRPSLAEVFAHEWCQAGGAASQVRFVPPQCVVADVTAADRAQYVRPVTRENAPTAHSGAHIVRPCVAEDAAVAAHAGGVCPLASSGPTALAKPHMHLLVSHAAAAPVTARSINERILRGWPRGTVFDAPPRLRESGGSGEAEGRGFVVVAAGSFRPFSLHVAAVASRADRALVCLSSHRGAPETIQSLRDAFRAALTGTAAE